MLKKIAIVDKDEEYTMQLKKSIEKISNDFIVMRYTNLTDLMMDKKEDNFDVVLVETKIKTKCKDYLKLSETIDDDKHVYKYKKVTLIINDIYRYINSHKKDETVIHEINDDKNNIIVYDVSDTKNTIRCIDKFIKALANNDKCFVWNDKMFTNDDNEDGLDVVCALYNNSVLENINIENKLKQIDKNIYGFYSTKNICEFLNFKETDINKLYSKISKNKYNKVFVLMSGDIKKYELEFINKTKKIYLMYESDDYTKKNKVKNFFEKYIKTNKLNANVIDFNVENNERKELMKISNMVNACD